MLHQLRTIQVLWRTTPRLDACRPPARLGRRRRHAFVGLGELRPFRLKILQELRLDGDGACTPIDPNIEIGRPASRDDLQPLLEFDAYRPSLPEQEEILRPVLEQRKAVGYKCRRRMNRTEL